MSTLSLVVSSVRRLPGASRPTFKWIALGYVAKTTAFGVAWYFVPDLPERLLSGAQAAWAWLLAP